VQKQTEAKQGPRFSWFSFCDCLGCLCSVTSCSQGMPSISRLRRSYRRSETPEPGLL